MTSPVRVVVPNAPAAPLGQLLDAVVREGVIPQRVADAIRATERHYNARVPDTVSGPANPWKLRQSALIAARASKVLRFNPTLALAEWLLFQGLEALSQEVRRQAERDYRPAPLRPLFVPQPGVLSPGGWTELFGLQADPQYEGNPAEIAPLEWATIGAVAKELGTFPAALRTPPVTGDYVGQLLTSFGPAPHSIGPTFYAANREWGWSGSGDPLTVSDPIVLLVPASSPVPRSLPWPLATPRNRTDASPWPLGRQATYHSSAVRPGTGRVDAVRPGLTHEGDWAVTAPAGERGPPGRDASSTRYSTSREMKLKFPLWRKAMAVRFLEELLEAGDTIGAVYKALPVEVQRAVRQRWVEEQFRKGVKRPAREVPDDVKLGAIWEFWRFLDYEGVKRELQWEAFSDLAYGALGQLLAAANTRQLRTTTTSPAQYDDEGWSRGDHPLDPSIPWGKGQPLEGFQDWFTGRSARRADQSSSAAVREFAIAEAARYRQDRNARLARKRAYREANGPRKQRNR